MNQTVNQFSSPAEAMEIAMLSWSVGLVPNFVGPNGIGKTTTTDALMVFVSDIIRKDEEERKAKGEQVDPVPIEKLCYDMQGIPVEDMTGYGFAIDVPVTSWNPYGKKAVKLLTDALPQDPRMCGLLVYEEVDRTTPQVHNNLQHLVWKKKLGTYNVPAGMHQICEMNGKCDRYTIPLSNALKDRLTMVYFGINKDWYRSNRAYAEGKGMKRLADFNEANPFPVEELEDLCVDRPRSRERATTLYLKGKESGVSTSAIKAAMRGCCTQATGDALFAFYESFTMADLFDMSRDEIATLDQRLVVDVINNNSKVHNKSKVEALLKRLSGESLERVNRTKLGV